MASWSFWLVVGLSVVSRLYNPSALWLDEAQSVAIARLPMDQLVEALRQDGSPPLYYLLLHYWIVAFGTGTVAVRLLSSAMALLTLPAAYLAGRAWRDGATGRAAVVVAGVSPFAVRYATETRMYTQMILLGLLAMWALAAALRRPSPARLATVAAVSGLLALTHYWALFFLAALGGWLVLRRRWRVLTGLCAGAILFVPWLPTFLFQVQHTGTPWASAPSLGAVFDVGREWAGGNRPAADLLFVIGLLLAMVAVAGLRADGGVRLSWPPTRTGLALLGACVGTLLIGVIASEIIKAGFPVRYSAVAFAPGVLLVAVGARVLPVRARVGALALVAVLGLIGSLPQSFQDNRTQAAEAAATIRSGYAPGDLVVFCPDQLGPAVTRLLPEGTATAVYPSLAAGDRVNWVDYAQRNKTASVSVIADQINSRAPGAIWLVAMPGYRTYKTQCEQLAYTLGNLRGNYVIMQQPNTRFAEPDYLIRYPRR